MNRVEAKVRAARRRLIFSRFGRSLCWTLAVAWFIAGLAIGLRAFWFFPVQPELWSQAWLVGSSVIAMVAALGHTLWTRPALRDVAVVVDQRFGLKQRLGSALSLDPRDRDTAMGQALIEDAQRRAEGLVVPEQFPLQLTRLCLLPLGPALLLAIAWLMTPVSPSFASAAPTPELAAQAEQLKKSTETLKKKIVEQKEKAEAAGLKDAAEMFTKLEAKIDKMAQRDAVNPKEAMIALNDLKKQLDERRKQLGTPESMRETLAKMNDSEKGPAADILKSMKDGEFAQAKDQAKALAEKLRSDKLTPEEKAELKKQIEAARDQIKQAAEKHQAEKERLQKEIDEAKRDGRGEDAAKLQQQLNQLESKDSQMQQMQQMAEAMSDAAEAMAEGDSQQAAEAMDAMAEQMGDMQEAMDQLQDLEETLDTLSQSKSQMQCKSCNGSGCKDCNGGGEGGGQGEGEKEGGKSEGKGGSKYGLGKGSGLSGPEEKDPNPDSYESQVRGEPKKGRGMNAGYADGPNRKGVTREDIKEAVLGAMTEESDPLENQNLPYTEREHAREYFDKLRSGK